MHLWYCQTADIRQKVWASQWISVSTCPQMQLGLSPKAQPCPESQLWSRSTYDLLLSKPSCWISTERRVMRCLSPPVSKAYPGHLVVFFQGVSASSSYLWHCLSTTVLCCCCFFVCVCMCPQLKLIGIKVMVAQKKRGKSPFCTTNSQGLHELSKALLGWEVPGHLSLGCCILLPFVIWSQKA